MKYNPEIHHRRSVRLKGYDYSKAGFYFITICTQDRMCLFGEIKDDEMVINDAGHMVNRWWHDLNHKYKNIKLHEQVVMPNHFHGIIQIKSAVTVGADLCVCPDDMRACPDVEGQKIKGEHTGSPLRNMMNPDKSMTGEHIGSPQRDDANVSNPPLHAMIQWFKTMTTNEYIRCVKNNHWQPFNRKLWQRLILRLL